MDSEQFEKYQIFTEKTIYKLSKQLTDMEKKLDMLSSLLEISKYINQNIKDPNLLPLINDMLIGVFGAKFSTIYLKLDGNQYEAVAQNVSSTMIEIEKQLIKEHNEEEFVINCEVSIYADQTKDSEQQINVHSCLGVPIKVDHRLLGFILIQHNEIRYFSKDHAVFLTLIGNHIGVAIENNLLYKQIRDSAYRDSLTNLYNKRYLLETLDQSVTDVNYSIILIDIDAFKVINDKYGHMTGDIVIKKVAEIITKHLHPNDTGARFGGDEFIIFLNESTDKEEILKRVNEIRDELERNVVITEDGALKVTASFGIYIKDNKTITLEEAIKKADDLMYLSKSQGKNRVSIS